jgi:signal peptidase I
MTTPHPGSRNGLTGASVRRLIMAQVGVVSLVALLLLERRIGIDYFRVVSGSMSPTLGIGDVVIVDRWSRVFSTTRRVARPTLRGTIVTVSANRVSREPLIKRVSATAGDTVYMRAGALYVNGARRDPSCVVTADTIVRLEDNAEWASDIALTGTRFGRPPRQHTNRDWGPFIVPADSVFVLGDNRDHSRDSRTFGFIGESEIIGIALRVVRNRRLESICA